MDTVAIQLRLWNVSMGRRTERRLETVHGRRSVVVGGGVVVVVEGEVLDGGWGVEREVEIVRNC